MHYKTLKTSPTGKKLQIVEDKLTNALALSKYLALKLGVAEWQQGPTVYGGGINKLFYAKGVKAPRYMKAQKGGGFMPDMDSVEGQTIQKEIDKLPLVYIREVNEAVKFDGLGLMSIDVHFTHPEYYLFTINREALKTGIIAYFHPDDISKIEESEYKSLKQISPTK